MTGNGYPSSTKRVGMGDGNDDFEVPMLSDSGRSLMLSRKISRFYFCRLKIILHHIAVKKTYTTNFFHEDRKTCHKQLSFSPRPFFLSSLFTISYSSVEDYLQKLENCSTKIKAEVSSVMQIGNITTF